MTHERTQAAEATGGLGAELREWQTHYHDRAQALDKEGNERLACYNQGEADAMGLVAERTQSYESERLRLTARVAALESALRAIQAANGTSWLVLVEENVRIAEKALQEGGGESVTKEMTMDSNGWIATTERSPEPGVRVLILHGHSMNVGWISVHKQYGWQGNGPDGVLAPDFWMPLPALPQSVIEEIEAAEQERLRQAVARTAAIAKLTQEERSLLKVD